MLKSVEKIVFWRWDRYCRYNPILKYLKNKYGHSRINILEVGCGDYSMGLYDGYKVDGLDIREPDSKKHLNNFFKASIHDNKLSSNSYDIVICVDFLEHLPENEREVAIHKMLDITKMELIMVFPEGKKALEADKSLYSFYKKTVHPFHIWFEEHVNFGLPEDKKISNYILNYTKKEIKKVMLEKICDLEKHKIYSKLLMTKNYRYFLIKNKMLGIFDLFFGKLITSEDCYRSIYFIEIK